MEEAEVISTSPVIKKGTAQTMNFPDAMAKVILGGRVTRLEWASNEDYGYLKGERLIIHTKGEDHLWIVQESDMKANDWVTIPTVN